LPGPGEGRIRRSCGRKAKPKGRRTTRPQFPENRKWGSTRQKKVRGEGPKLRKGLEKKKKRGGGPG